jgi:hypothetical protein
MISWFTIILLLHNGVPVNSLFSLGSSSNDCNYNNKETCIEDLDCGWCNNTIVENNNYEDNDYEDNDYEDNDYENSSMCINLDSCTGIPDHCISNIKPTHICVFNIVMLLFIVTCLLIIVWWLLSEQFKSIIELKDKQIKYYCQLCNGRNINSKNNGPCEKCTILEKKYYQLAQRLSTFTQYIIIIPLVALLQYDSMTFVLIIMLILFFIILSLNITMCFIRSSPLSIDERNNINHTKYMTFHNDL